MINKNNIKKIAVLRANGLGDFLFCLPSLEALKKTFPKSEIYYLGAKWHKEFLSNRPSPIDHLIVVPISKGIREERGKKEDKKELNLFFKKMQNKKFDIAIQMHGGGKFSNPFIKKISANLSVGFQDNDAEPLDISIPYIYFQNEIVRYLEIVQKIGASIKTLEPKINIIKKDLEELERVYPNLIDPFIVLHPGANDERRRMPSENFASIGDYFVKKGYKIFITGNKNEQKIIKKIISLMRNKKNVYTKLLSINGLVGLLSKAKLVISNDTGPLHLANALGKSTVGIYWIPNMINAAFLYRENHIPITSWTNACPVCKTPYDIYSIPNKRGCKHKASFVSDIPINEVIFSAEKLLNKKL